MSSEEKHKKRHDAVKEGYSTTHFPRNYFLAAKGAGGRRIPAERESRDASHLSYTVSLMASMHSLDDLWMGRPRSIATALLESNGHRALVDPGPGSTLEHLRQQLHARSLSVGDIDALLLTHIHLDHAGASGALVRENPRLAVYVHKLGAPHMIDPSKLLASAARLWPNDLHRLFGETLPVPAENLRILEGGETLTLGERMVEVAYTPGHASHHVSYFENLEGVAFVGDTAGVRIEGNDYVMPATPPPDIDLGVWETSFAAILARKPTRLFLTHFGFSEKPAEHIALFRERLHRWAATTADIIRGAASDTEAMERFMATMRQEIGEHLPAQEVEHYVFSAGLNLSFLGLARYLRKRAQAAS
ncbi:MAG TPA: MBL fold metallo-hydrolase [Candidatus Angelobacter sp.]|nr:MBL fold metallo-hydrolase [Candidatus Angelobacter sp.]